MRTLLEFGNKEVDIPADDGETPVALAFSRGDEETLHALVHAGATVDLEALKQVKMKDYMSVPRTNEAMIEVVKCLVAEKSGATGDTCMDGV